MTTYININGDVREASSLVVPADRTFRGAWAFNGDAVEIDMTAAKAIHKDNLRAERAPRLADLDVAYMKALEAGTGADAIAAQKATLRDITDDARIDAASTPDALKALDLATLLGE
jgi:ADP-ribose pyrophosphatase YjhB (NUDIX family)